MIRRNIELRPATLCVSVHNVFPAALIAPKRRSGRALRRVTRRRGRGRCTPMLPRSPEGTRLTLPGDERQGHRHAHTYYNRSNRRLQPTFKGTGTIVVSGPTPLPIACRWRLVAIASQAGKQPSLPGAECGRSGVVAYAPAAQRRHARRPSPRWATFWGLQRVPDSSLCRGRPGEGKLVAAGAVSVGTEATCSRTNSVRSPSVC